MQPTAIHLRAMTDEESKTEIISGTQYTYSSSWINSLESERHWRLYWQQQKLMEDLVTPGQHVLEIGVGSGFAANYLRSKDTSVTTLDIDKDKKPDIVANLVTYKFQRSYDHILGFEVFEHIPFEEFETLLGTFSKVCKGYLFLSLPRNERVWLRCECKLPLIGTKNFSITTKKRKVTESHHFWEVDYGKYSRKNLENTFEEHGFKSINRAKKFSKLFYALQSPYQK